MGTQRTDQAFVSRFSELAPELRQGPAWLTELRDQSLNCFVERGLPTVRDEDWKYTSLRALSEEPIAPLRAAQQTTTNDLAALRAFALPGAAHAVSLDGFFVPALTDCTGLPAGVKLGSLRQALSSGDDTVRAQLGQHEAQSNHALRALNIAWMQDGLVLVVPSGVKVDQPIHLLFANRGVQASASHPRAMIVLGKQAQATVVETHVGLADQVYLTNAAADIVLAEGAELSHVRVQRETKHAFHLAHLAVRQTRGSRLNSLAFALGGKLVRNDIDVALAQAGSHCTLNGLYVGDEHQHIDNHTAIDHQAPHCTSDELYKGILAGHATGVFNGKVFVRPGAQKTDAKQRNPNLLLSDEATVNTKPQLEIFADDVTCTHAATIGQIDTEALFYLRSRGLAEAEARRLLVYAFASDLASQVPVEALRVQLDAWLGQRLPAGDLH